MPSREQWIGKSLAYYQDIAAVLKYLLPAEGSVLEVGCSTGWLLAQLPQAGGRVGVDSDAAIIQEAKQLRGGQIQFVHADFQDADLGERFDFIILSDVVPFAYDVQKLLENARRHLKPGGRVFISSYNPYLKPLFRIFEILGFKRASRAENWLTRADLENLADLAGFERVRQGSRAILPWRCLGLGRLLNRFLSPLPVFAWSNLYYYSLLRERDTQAAEIQSVSVIVPARNEAGNIPHALTRLPRLAPRVEMIFVEGHSQDDTWQAIQTAVAGPKPEWLQIKALRQTGKGKADAVHLGFAHATGDVLLILDADLTVPPEELPRFVETLRSGKADFVHGSRLVYPMEGEAMRFLNLLGNKFFSIAFSFLLGQPFKDTLCGTKVFWRRDWQRILALRSYFGDFDPFGDFEMIFGAIKLNHKVAEIPVHYKQRSYGATNISRFRHGLILLRMVCFAALRMKFI